MFSKNELKDYKFKSTYEQEKKHVKLSIINKRIQLSKEFIISSYIKSACPKDASLIVQQNHENECLENSFQDDCENNQQFILVKCLKDLKNLVLDSQQNKIVVVEIMNYSKYNINVEELVTLIQQCKYLEQFFFLITGRNDGNKIAQLIGEALIKPLRIVSLDITYCNMSTEGIKDLCEGLIRCQMISCLILRLTQNLLNDEAAFIIGNSISQLLRLRHLQLEIVNNNEVKQGFIELANLMRKCLKLEFLEFELTLKQLTKGNFNKQEIQIIQDFGNAIATYKSLFHLRIDCNFIFMNQLYVALSKSQSLVIVEIIRRSDRFDLRIGIKRHVLKTKRLTILKFI